MAHTMLYLLLLAVFCTSNVLADDRHFYAFCPKNQSDLHRIENAPAGEPATNGEFWSMLIADGASYPSNSTNPANGGETSWRIATVDAGKVEKYKIFQLLAIVSDLNDTTNPGVDIPTLDLMIPRNTSKDSVPEGVVSQYGAPRQLKFISLPKDQNNNLDKTGLTYKYYESAGRGIRVYVVDSGLNTNSYAWGSQDQRVVEFLYAEPFSSRQAVDLDNKFGHGTCVADLAVGLSNGVAKRADISAVQRFPDPSTPDLEARRWVDLRLLAGLDFLIFDIFQKGVNGKAVVVMAFGHFHSAFLTSDRWEFYKEQMYRRLDVLDKLGVAVVATVPNEGKCTDRIPCSFGNPSYDRYLPNLIVVEGSDIQTGQYAGPEEQRNDWVTIHAPSTDSKTDIDGNRLGIECVPGQGNSGRSSMTAGSSAGAGIVGGLMAYFMGLGMTHTAARQAMLDYAYARSDVGPKMPYNNVPF